MNNSLKTVIKGKKEAFKKTAYFLCLTQFKRTLVVPNICLEKYFGEGNTNLRAVQLKCKDTAAFKTPH